MYKCRLTPKLLAVTCTLTIADESALIYAYSEIFK